MDYEPLDLSAHCNSPASAVGSDRLPATGDLLLRGLPFTVGAGESNVFACLDGRSEALSISVGRLAKRVIFAHAMVESELHDGDPVGREIARYALVYADGRRVETPIRERFEIAQV